MRARTAAAVAVAAALIGTSAAQATPSADFFLDASEPCVAGTCVAAVSYDTSVLTAAVTVAVDWDTRDSAGGFQPDATLACPSPPPENPYSAPPCTGRSPVYRQAGTATVAVRVSDAVDGT